MRTIFGVIGLLMVLAIVGLIAKSQLTSTRQAIPVLAVPGAAASEGANTTPAANVKEQSQQIQQQYKQALDNAMQQARPVPDDK